MHLDGNGLMIFLHDKNPDVITEKEKKFTGEQ